MTRMSQFRASRTRSRTFRAWGLNDRSEAPSGASLGYSSSLRRSGRARTLRLPRDALDDLARILLLRFAGDVRLRNHAHEALILAGYCEAPDLMPRHELERIREIVVGMDSDKLARRDCRCRHPLRILALRDCAHDDVSIRDDAHQPIVFHHGDRSDVLRFHQLSYLC